MVLVSFIFKETHPTYDLICYLPYKDQAYNKKRATQCMSFCFRGVWGTIGPTWVYSTQPFPAFLQEAVSMTRIRDLRVTSQLLYHFPKARKEAPAPVKLWQYGTACSQEDAAACYRSFHDRPDAKRWVQLFLSICTTAISFGSVNRPPGRKLVTAGTVIILAVQ